MKNQQIYKIIQSKNDRELRKWLKNRGNPNCVIDNYSILQIAVASNYNIGVDLLLESGADPNQASKDGESALALANGYFFSKEMEIKNREITKNLLKYGADANYECKTKKMSPLMIACSNRRLENVKMLLENGALINYQDKNGDFALLLSIEYRIKISHGGVIPVDYNLVKLLLGKKANTRLSNKNMVNVMKVSQERKDAVLIRMFSEN